MMERIQAWILLEMWPERGSKGGCMATTGHNWQQWHEAQYATILFEAISLTESAIQDNDFFILNIDVTFKNMEAL
jgi:hypothetical protein